jgi:hypothetical protein
MKLSLALVLSSVSLLAASSASADYCINKDLINLGPPAYDIAVVITGNQPLTLHYDGETGEQFAPPTVTLSGANEVIHWQNLNMTHAVIPTGTPGGAIQIHIGWCTLMPNNIVNMNWTDLSGAPISTGWVDQVGGHSSASSTNGVQWDNASAHSFVINRIYYALFPTPWTLSQLNRHNTVLAGQLVPLPGGSSVPLSPGGSVTLTVPSARSGQWIVLRYGVSGPGSQAQVNDYVQFQLP